MNNPFTRNAKLRKAVSKQHEMLVEHAARNDWLWEKIDDLSERLERTLRSEGSYREQLRTIRRNFDAVEEERDALLREVTYMREVWHPPTVDEAFRYAQNELNGDYWALPRDVNWQPVGDVDDVVDPIQSDNPLLGEQPPIDPNAVIVGSADVFDELPIPIPRHEGPGL